MTTKKTYKPDAERTARLAERAASERRQAKAYRPEKPRPAVKAPVTAGDKLANRLYPNG
jgi:hypothetical protein